MQGWGIIAIVVSAASATAACAQGAEELRALLQRGDARAAYEAGRRTPERLGEPEFDLQFGIAAINAGHASEGVLALERFLLAHPDNDSARIELARGYFLIGDDARAKEEFETALAHRPPGAVAAVIEEYLAAIHARESRYKPTRMAYLDAGGGYDSNPRAGVDNPVITLPVFGEVTIGDIGVRHADRNAQYGGGFRLTAPAGARTTVFASGQADFVRYRDATDFDQNSYAGSVGLAGRSGTRSWRAGAVAAYQTLGRQPYRHTAGAFADSAWAFSERLVFTAGYQRGRFHYEGANEVRGSDFDTAALALRYGFGGASRPTLELAANGGRETNNHERPDLSRDMYGARLGIAASPWRSWTLGAGVAWERSRYHSPDTVLDTTRDDRYVAGDLFVAWAPLSGFTLRLEATAAKNHSSLELYEYRRTTAMLRGRYEFR